MYFVDRFFKLQAAGKSDSFPLELRAVFRHRPKKSVGADNEEAELAIYADECCVGRKYRIVPKSQLETVLEEMMYDLLQEAVMFGFYAKQRQQEFVRSESLSAPKNIDFLCPERIAHYAKVPGELLQNERP